MRRSALTLVAAFAMLASLALPASADHTDPNSPITLNSSATPLPGGEPSIVPSPEGVWDHQWWFPGHEASDITFFRKGGNLYASQGTLGQGLPRTVYVGQRITQLMEGDEMLDPPRIRADHGSAACTSPATSATGLQHDSFATPPGDPEILTDSTDAVGRCHDTGGGGLELIDISGLDDPEFEPRELHLLRFNAYSHTTTLDPERPWIIYSNNSSANGTNFLDFADIRSCLTESNGGFIPDGVTEIDDKRELCRPEVYRIPFEDEWTQGTVTEDGEPTGNAQMCHDTVIEDNILYCSGLHGEVLLDISDLTDEDGDPRGEPLECELVEGTNSTGAMVTDCALGGPTVQGAAAHEAWEAQGSPQATGWEYLGHFNHPGRTADNTNSNTQVRADRGVAVSHETRPFPQAATGDRRFMLVSDERGGGVIPGGASCTDDNFDIYGHGGLHVFDYTDPSNIQHAKMLDDNGEEQRAFWRTENIFPHGTFCVAHRFRFLEGEQRFIMGYYTQGVRIIDYEIDEDGYISFEEVGSYAFKESNTWTGDVFHHEDNENGTRTYYIAVTDTLGSPSRGMDILTWTHTPNPIDAQQQPPGEQPQPPGPPVDPDPTETDTVTVQRVAGDDRIGTAIEVSQEVYPDGADTVVIARADEFADALAGAPLAKQEEAPILLTISDQVLPAVEAEIERLGASTAILLGGEAALSSNVAAQLRDMGLDVERVWGANRFGTAAQIAEAMGGQFESVFLTEGIHPNPDRGWPDAMSAAPYAAFSERPVLLVAHDILPPETRQALDDTDAEETVVVGGSAAVSDRVFDEIEEAGHGPRRLAGGNRFETSAAVYNEGIEAGMAGLEPGMDQSTLWVATGQNWPDALTGGAAVGARGETLVLVARDDLADSPATRDLIAEHREEITHVNLLGGRAAITQNVEDQIREILDAPDADDDATMAAAPGGATPLRAAGSPLSADAALLLAGLGLLPLAAFIGRRRRRLGDTAPATA
jgi:putative cell wall-binding protein